ncbi:glutamate synthase (NADPH/NADH) large chain/glutamate synthase (ferredoxin) [Roseimicrobium gellanilyticum]|uniref:Glutamate synthase [NADPH] large chain n=1 Tax=Roseimicrobium gellanilyticum TaxID=748857 RepID=A0A366H2R8_9BACT|nr:glutamate synthase large subunit [Roseimicrobium gellanilyticum]RBP36075.1 glutamate synthase (NADPH/NADH) large chain/glutamate synthase (ferredoxin) [Roseimicrobium gellanilyticum]
MTKHPYYDLPIPNEGSLHRMELERDACGVGFVAKVDGTRSHEILELALGGCCAVVHRGAMEADMKTGDGAGVLAQIPHKILLPVAKEEFGVELDHPLDLAVGVFFLPQDELQRIKIQTVAEGAVAKRGIRIIGWRKVPVNANELGTKSLQTMPYIMHLLMARPEGMDDGPFERALYMARRELILKSRSMGLAEFYVPSMSHKTIIYKALVIATALGKFYQDLQDERFETSLAIFHQRFSTNTFPTWALSHPFRMLAHNGEINTVRGNRNWVASRASDFEHEFWENEEHLLKNLCAVGQSDSASLDAALELLVLSGRDLTHAMSMLVPAAYGIDPTTTDEEKAYYEYHSCFSEPWDGPAALVATDGVSIVASLDRNGLRPSRYKLTEDGIFALGSEVGIIPLDDRKVIKKGRLAPGEMIEVNTLKGTVTSNGEIKAQLAANQPYGEWLKANRHDLTSLAPHAPKEELDILSLSQKQVTFGWNKEEIDMAFAPMLAKGEEVIYSMGDDAALSALSKQPKVLFTYFKQLFAQVTNPPIDPIRERAVMSLDVVLGWQRNWLAETPEHASVVHLKSPFLFENELEKLKNLENFPCRVLDTTWAVSEGTIGLRKAVERLCAEAEKAVEDNVRILILSDRTIDHNRVPVPSLIATGAVHHHLNRAQKRMRLSIVVDTGEARDTHQMACLFGFGASAVCPYLAFETVQEVLDADKTARKPLYTDLDFAKLLTNYRKSLEKGVLKIMSKMGISVLSSYTGAQIFEAVGIGKEVMDSCFTGTPSQIAGIGFDEIAEESLARHAAAYTTAVPESGPIELADPGFYRPRRDGELHSVTGPVIKNFHTFVKSGKPEDYDKYVSSQLENRPAALKDLFEFVPDSGGPIPLDEVEPIEDIRVRFTTAAMSLGAISPEAHEALAIAMNSIGGKSDSGEGGEDPRRFKPYENGDWAMSKIKQVASGRFGVTAEYLANAWELEIKMAQGAKPGEGGQLPAMKVSGLIARLRHTQPGVSLISPPPHHDIYSIEDLAQLIHDLKEANPRARVCVKLVAETGVGTVAAGVAKANADIILVSGHEGGTGASPLSSIKHAGLPWELGLAETQQVLMLNGLRDRVTLRTDGGLRNGRDIVTAAILGAEEFNFGTIALIALGCVYVRQCHLNNCPVGVATTDPKFRQKFKGKPEHVVNFFNAVAEETRAIMAQLGVAKMNDLIGRPEFLKQRVVPDHKKANLLDLSRILRDVGKELGQDAPRICRVNSNERINHHPLDDKIMQAAQVAISDKRKVNPLRYKVKNTDRNIGTKLAGEIAFHHGNHGLQPGTVEVNCEGSAGQSFGTFLCGGVSLNLTGEANDYVGKGLCGGEIVIRPPAKTHPTFQTHENSIVGNTLLYGATSGSLFAAGRAGERFCVRNSGATAVIEGIGDHGCEYMTGGVVAVLGSFGKNFGAGMSGGVAYLLDEAGMFAKLHNPEMIKGGALEAEDDVKALQALIYKHLEKTDSPRARDILDRWDHFGPLFVKVSPKVEPVAVPGEDEPPSDDTLGAKAQAGVAA